MTIVVVTGGRKYSRGKRVNQILDAAVERLGMTLLVQGQGSGLDTLAWKWADRRGFPMKSFPADWAKFGLSAGPIRNGDMAKFVADHEDPEKICIAFPGGDGTWNMIAHAERYGIRVIRIDR